jgi:hypothetical protein
VTSVAAVYRAAGAHRLALDLVWRWFRRRAAALVGLPAGVGLPLLAERLAGRSGGSVKEYAEIMTACEQAVEQPRLSASGAAALLAQLGQIETELFHGHRTGR